MTKQILLSLLNCSWQWGLLGCLTWLVTRRFRRANSTTHLIWLLFLTQFANPIRFKSVCASNFNRQHIARINAGAAYK